MNRYAICLAALLLTPLPASAESYRMLVNHGVGWSRAGDFDTLEECKLEAAEYATKYSVQAGCTEVSLLEFQQAARMCAALSGVEITLKPGAKVNTLGTERQLFKFDQCMLQKGQPIEGVR